MREEKTTKTLFGAAMSPRSIKYSKPRAPKRHFTDIGVHFQVHASYFVLSMRHIISAMTLQGKQNLF